MCTAYPLAGVVNASHAMIDVEVRGMFHGRVYGRIYFFQFDGGKVEQGADPFGGIGILGVHPLAVYQFGRALEEPVEDMVGKEHVERVVPVGQGMLVPEQLFIGLTFGVFRHRFV